MASCPPMIMGYYPYVRDGQVHPPRTVLDEIRACLEINPWYRDRMLFLAADANSARVLQRLGLQVTRTFEDAPEHVWKNAAHRMKHWMGLWALKEFGEYLWVDWDTVYTQLPDEAFENACRQHNTPKFIFIPGYQHAVVNCGVMYVPETWAVSMAEGLETNLEKTNDEHIWETVLPSDVLDRKEFWWSGESEHIQSEKDFHKVTRDLYFAHVGNLKLADGVRELFRKCEEAL